VIRQARPPTVVVIGSECTGKTTLAAALAERFGAVWSREFAREYVGRKQAPPDASDVEPIGRGQLAGESRAEREAVARGGLLVVRDTDLHSTVVYSRHYYGNCPRWIVDAARRRTGDLYLLLRPDVPWVADGPYRDRPDESARRLIHRLFREQLAAAGARTVEIGGSWAERRARAEAAVARLIAAGGPPARAR
jgi:NadR type nicotinamide-nucleotide adenylyltransferase